ncbi:MAG: UbiX family flavin prenyltransferase [Gaiellales bacterium]|nr:MAG: UbiX family flavin prenyltransferase [Gaiellales bacterium]
MKVFVGISGASGAIYGAGLLRALLAAGSEVSVCISDGAIEVIRAEDGIGAGSRGEVVSAFFQRHSVTLDPAALIDTGDMASAFASGSALAGAAVVCPCSMSTLGSIAAGITRNLIHRVADVMLKEGRPLVLVPRETPLSAIHLENMLRVKRAGAAIVPAMPGFYQRPESIDDLVDFNSGKVLDVLGIRHELFNRWDGPS